MGTQVSDRDVMRLTSEVVSAYVSAHAVSSTQLPEVVAKVHEALKTFAGAPAPAAVELKPAVPIKKSITDDYLICLEDGKKLKMLKCHLRAAYDLSPDEYRAKWGLPADYPMVAPNYAARRSAFAREIGLGRGGRGSKKAA